MTEPVAPVASPRRAVRFAVALAVGQAALCAVIGWVTFGSSPTQPSRPVDPPLAAPAPVLPTASGVEPSSVVPSARPTSARASRPAGSNRPPKPPLALERAGGEAPATEPTPATLDTSSPAVPSASTPPKARPPRPKDPVATPDPALSDDVPGPVVEGETCERKDALGLTEDGVVLRCVLEEDGRLVWQIN